MKSQGEGRPVSQSNPADCLLFGLKGERQSGAGEPVRLMGLGGLAGTGKTVLLRWLAAQGEQVLDLETLAGSAGSVFGGLGRAPQPTHAEFQRRVRTALAATDPARVLWVEDEGPFIGSVGIPDALFASIQSMPIIELLSPFEDRVARILAEYGHLPIEDLGHAVERLTVRLGSNRSQLALAALDAGSVEEMVRVVLPYYDAAYTHRTDALHRRVVARVDAVPHSVTPAPGYEVGVP